MYPCFDFHEVGVTPSDLHEKLLEPFYKDREVLRSVSFRDQDCKKKKFKTGGRIYGKSRTTIK